MLKKQTNGIQLSVADPTQLLDEIEVVLSGAFSGSNVEIKDNKTTVKVLLPKEGEAGKTVNLILKNM